MSRVRWPTADSKVLAARREQAENWSERGDLNSRPPVPQTGALTELRYAPTLETNHLPLVRASTNRELPPNCHPRCRIKAGLGTN